VLTTILVKITNSTASLTPVTNSGPVYHFPATLPSSSFPIKGVASPSSASEKSESEDRRSLLMEGGIGETMFKVGVGKGDIELFGEAETDRAPVEEDVADTPSSEPGLELGEILMIVDDFR